jgi:hypothetical protein
MMSAISWQEQITFDKMMSAILCQEQATFDEMMAAISWQEQGTFDVVLFRKSQPDRDDERRLFVAMTST